MNSDHFRILCLDGGGAKGVYSLGVLKELEAAATKPLSEYFDLIYGVSTGAIIATLLALGRDVASIYSSYLKLAPQVMSRITRSERSTELARFVNKELGGNNYADLKTRVGIVALDMNRNHTVVFKSSADLAHSGKATFIPGLGVSLANAVLGSSAAFPLFQPVKAKMADGLENALVDGGLVANNPTLFAILDALGPLSQDASTLRVISIGTGQFSPASYPIGARLTLLYWIKFLPLMETLLTSSAETLDFVRSKVYPDVITKRISGAHPGGNLATNLMECNPAKLSALHDLGRKDFRSVEIELRKCLGL